MSASPIAGSPRSKLATVFKANDLPPAHPAPGLDSVMHLISRRPTTVVGSARSSVPKSPRNPEAVARIEHDHQRSRLKQIMQTMGTTDGKVSTADLLLSAKLAKIDLPEEFLLKSPYAKQYATEFDSSGAPAAISWRPFYSAVEYNKIQRKDEWSKAYADREARKAAAKAAAEKAAAEKAAAEKAAEEKIIEASRPKREYVSDDELRRAHAVIKSRLTTQFNDLRQAFRNIDKDGSGYVTPEEACSALSVLGLGLPMRIMQRIVDIADYDGDGDISFAEFARVLNADDIMLMKDTLRASGGNAGMLDSHNKGPSKKKAPRVIKDGVTEDDVRSTVAQIKDKLLAKYSRLDTAFKQIDEDRSGHLTREEFKFLMKVLNLDSTKDAVLNVLCDIMDSDGDGQINHQEFTHLLSAEDPINSGPLAAKVQAVYKRNH